MTQSLRSADGRKLVHKRKCKELKLFLTRISKGYEKIKKTKKIRCQIALWENFVPDTAVHTQGRSARHVPADWFVV